MGVRFPLGPPILVFMKLLRVGHFGKECPAILDEKNRIKSLKDHVSDLNPQTLNFETIKKLKEIDLTALPLISSKERVGACISNPGKFIGIGLNFSDHAIEQNLPIPKEPIVFSKVVSSIVGPYDDVLIQTLVWLLRLARHTKTIYNY